MSESSLPERLRSGWRAFRARSVYFQLKVLVGVAYVAVVAATLAFVLAPVGPGNELGARVTVMPGDPLMGRYFAVENTSGQDWIGVKLEVDGGYQVRRDEVLAGQKVIFHLRDFTRQEKVTRKKKTKTRTVAAPPKLAVTQLRIETLGGVAVHRLSPDAP